MEEHECGDSGRDGPEERGLVIDTKDEAQAGEAALGGEGDGPVDVVVQTCGELDDEECCSESG